MAPASRGSHQSLPTMRSAPLLRAVETVPPESIGIHMMVDGPTGRLESLLSRSSITK